MGLRGRFEGDVDALMQRFSSSLAIDLEMLDEDIDGSMAHARMLAEVGVLTADEAETICAALASIRDEIRSGDWTPTDAHEDVHMAVEARLIERIGDLGGKLHTARSRNDQCATDVRLWLKRRLALLDTALAELLTALLDRVEADGRTLMPGYTHLQRGQPILLGHHLLAHAWSLHRDRGRVADALRRLDESPLGACAMAGTAFPIDRERTAELLGFARPVPNAMDAVAARDHEVEVAAACTIVSAHLSRIAEELVAWSGTEFGFVRLPDAFATGSSIMPQKRNPDAAELVRGKAARVIGDLTALVTLLKAQPMSYNRDLQESREPLFHAVLTTLDCVRVSTGIFRGLEVDNDRFESDLAGDFSLATELADWLAQQGVPFREAHGVIGRLVRACDDADQKLDDLDADGRAAFHPLLGEAPAELLDPRAAAERRTSLGGTAWSEIERQIANLRRGLG